MNMELTESSETSALKAQTPGDYPKSTIRHSTHCESLKSRLTRCYLLWHSVITAFVKMTCPTKFLSKYHTIVSILPLLTAKYLFLRNNRSFIIVNAITERKTYVSAYDTLFSSTPPYGEYRWVEFIEKTPRVLRD